MTSSGVKSYGTCYMICNENSKEREKQFSDCKIYLSPGETGNDVPGGYIEKERCI